MFNVWNAISELKDIQAASIQKMQRKKASQSFFSNMQNDLMVKLNLLGEKYKNKYNPNLEDELRVIWCDAHYKIEKNLHEIDCVTISNLLYDCWIPNHKKFIELNKDKDPFTAKKIITNVGIAVGVTALTVFVPMAIPAEMIGA